MVSDDEYAVIMGELFRLKEWFCEYDAQVAQYMRCQRLGVAYDKDMNELDAQAILQQQRIRDLRLQAEV
jgi:hypothetical protein